MPSKILDGYRQALAAQGVTDNRPDDFIIRELGPIIQQEAPQLFEQDPDLGELWSSVRDADAPSLPSEFGRAFRGGLKGLASTAVGGTALVTGSDYLRNKAAELDQSAAEDAPTIGTLEEIAPGRSTAQKVLSRDAMRYAISKFGSVAPSIAEAGATALAGAAIGSTVAPGPGTVAGAAEGLVARSLIKSAIRQLISKGIAEEMVAKGLVKEASEVALEQALKAGSKEVADVVGRQAISIGAKRGLGAANLANSYLLNAGDVYSEGADRPTSLALGLVSAIPDSALPTYLLGRLFPGVVASKAKELGKAYLADRAKKLLEAAGAVAVEGGTEYFQEGVNVVARNIKEGKDPLTFTDADLKRFREAGIAGAAGGGLAAPSILLEGNTSEVPAAPPPPAPAIVVPPVAGPAAPSVVPAPAGRTQAQVVQAVAAMPNEEKWVRLAELGARARSADEEAEFQLLQAQAPLPASTVAPDELAAVAQVNAPGVPAEQLGRAMVGETPELAAERAAQATAFGMAGAPVPDASNPEQVAQAAAQRVAESMVNGGVKPPAPAEFVGDQEGLPARDGRPAVPGFELYNLTSDIPGHPTGSTVSRQTLEAAGFEVPVRPKDLPVTPTSVMVGLSAKTSTIPGIQKLATQAAAGDQEAATVLRNVAHDSLTYLMSGLKTAKVDHEPVTGLYGGEAEPSLSLRVAFDEADRPQALAALAKFGENFNQEQVHVRADPDAGTEVGHIYPDGSFNTIVQRWELKKPMTQAQVIKLASDAGLYGLTAGDGYVEAYYTGRPDAQNEIEKFVTAAQQVTKLLGRRAASHLGGSQRFWAYGQGDGAIPYAQIHGDIRPEKAEGSRTAWRVAQRLAEREITPAQQAKTLTPEQVALQKAIAQSFENDLKVDNMTDPKVRRAYDELAAEVKNQFESMPIKVEVLSGKGEPYKNSSEMRTDVMKNNHLFIFGTDPTSFGPPGITYTDHPLLRDSGLKDINGHKLLYNDLLRAVHDYYAHSQGHIEFGPKGEEAAWRNHMMMTRSPWARWALTSETRGQNSVVNFGTHGEQNRSNPKETIFAEQKADLLPIDFAKTGDPRTDAEMDAIADKKEAPAVAPEPAIAPAEAQPETAKPFDQGSVIEGNPSVDFRTNPQFENFTADQWERALTASLESGPRSDKSGNRSLTRVAVAMQAPDGRVVVSGLTLPQKTLTSSGATTFNEAAVQRMGVTRDGRRAVEVGGNHPVTIKDAIAAGYKPIAVLHFVGEPSKIHQTFANAEAFDRTWGATEKTQGQQIRPPAMSAQPAIARNREAELTRRIDELGGEYLRAKDQVERNEISEEIKRAYADLERVTGQEQAQTGEVPLDEANQLRRSQQQSVQQADRGAEFQSALAALKAQGMKVDLFAKEIFAQSAREPIVQQIEQLKAQLAQAQGSLATEIQGRISQREERLAELDKAVGVAYSPWHVAISLEDVNKANLGNLVTLLHEAAESLTMRLNPVAKGVVLRAVDASIAELQTKATEAAAKTGASVAPTTSATDLLAETMAQRLAAAGVQDSQSLAQAIVRWVKDLYYRTVMAVQRGFGAEPDIETSLNWFENQLRREVGGDVDYRLTNLLGRYVTVPMIEQVRRFTGAKDTPAGVADFMDPLSGKIQQPWVEPTSTEALRWNVEFRQDDGVGAQNIPDPEARARIDAASLNEVLTFGEKLHQQIEPDMPWEQFWKLVGRGEDPKLLLADQARRFPGVETARIGGERMTKPMNDLSALNARILIEKIQLRQLREIARSKKQIETASEAMVAQAKDINKAEGDVRNAALHEDTLRAKLKEMARGLILAMRRGIDTAHTHGRLAEAIRQAEGLMENDPIPEAYQRVLKTAVDGTLPLFDSIRALAELDLPLTDMTNAEVVRAIRDNADANTQLRAMADNRPLAVAIAELARSNVEQVDQIQLGWLRDTTKFREIHQQLDEIRTASTSQLAQMTRQMDERARAKGLLERLRVGYLTRRRALQTQQNRIQVAEERLATLNKAVGPTAEQVTQAQQNGGGAYSEWYPVEGAKFTAMVPGDSGAYKSEPRRLSFNPDGSAVDSDQLKRDITNNMDWLRANAERAGTRHFEQVKRQTMELAMLDIQRKYPAGWVNMLDRMVQPLGAEARSAGHSSGARIAQMLQQFDFINRSHRDEASAAAHWWTRAFKDVEESIGIDDHGKVLSQIYDPVMYFLNVNPGLDEQHAIREATRMARQLLPKPPAENFNERFANLLRRTKENSELMLKIAEQYGVFVKDPRISNDLRSAVAQGWLTTPRSLRADVVQTIVRDMQQAGWTLKLKEVTAGDGTPRQSVVRATTFDGLSVEDLDPKNSQALSGALKKYFTPGIIDRWLVPFINKPGSEIFSWAGDPIPQLEVQQAWEKAGGDVLRFIDNLAAGQQLQVNEETGADPLADFRQNILGQIDRLFGMEAKLAYESQQVRDLFDPMGPKPHALMDARLNDLLPPDHVQFSAFDPTSSQRLLGTLAFHGAFGRNGERMVRTVNELKGVLSARKAEFDSLKGTTKGARAAEAAARGLNYRELEAGAERYAGVLELQSKLRGLFGTGNTAGPFADLRGGMEVMNAMTGQLVDNPKVGAYNLLSIAQRPFAMRSLGPMTITASIRGYANLLETALGSFLENLNIHVMRSSEYAKDVGSVEGQVFRNLPWGTVLADIGHRGKFQTSKTDRFLIQPLRAIRSIQRKGVKIGVGEGTREFPRLAVVPGLGVLNTISQIAAQANTMASVQMYEKIIRSGLTYFNSHPEALHDPSFRFTDKHLGIGRFDKGVLDYFRDKSVEYGIGNLEDVVRQAAPAAAKGDRLLTRDQVLRLAQMTANELDGAASINTTPSILQTNPLLKMGMPLLRWPLWMMHNVHQGLNTADGQRSLKAMAKGLGTLALWNLPMGIAFSLLLDQYDDKLLGKKSNLRSIDPLNAIPLVGPALGFVAGKDSPVDNALALLERSARAGNVYGLGADLAGQLVGQIDPSSGQRGFSLDQRVFAMSQFLSMSQSLRNLITQGGDATWASVGRQAFASMGGNGVLHSVDITNNLLGLDNAESRLVQRINAQNWLRSAGRETGVEVRPSGGASANAPTPMTVWTREMSLAAMANDRLGFLDNYRKALNAAREQVADDPRVSPVDREKEAANRVLASWRSRDPLEVFRFKPTPAQLTQLFSVMDEAGRADTQEAIRRYNSFSQLITPNNFDQYVGRQMSTATRDFNPQRMRNAGAGMLFSSSR